MQNSYCDHRNFDSVNQALVSEFSHPQTKLRTIASEGRAIPASLSCVYTTKACRVSTVNEIKSYLKK
jgi:hypothetical protein